MSSEAGRTCCSRRNTEQGSEGDTDERLVGNTKQSAVTKIKNPTRLRSHNFFAYITVRVHTLEHVVVHMFSECKTAI